MRATTFIPTQRTSLKRLPQRASYERRIIYQILDEGFICHLGFIDTGHPIVIPTAYGRRGDMLYIHGSVASRMLRALTSGTPVCVTVTLLDGLVLARSAFHHSMNYRSVVVFGTASVVKYVAEKLRALTRSRSILFQGDGQMSVNRATLNFKKLWSCVSRSQRLQQRSAVARLLTRKPITVCAFGLVKCLFL
jgi:nitroimidazol reductase NimA-like FMN-containing flavoprotein (pyridoxamine 5'-phosphate oxidase superfamily)